MNYQFRPIEKWPREWTKGRRASQFSSSYGSTLELLERELNSISARNVVIQLALTSADIRNDGLPRKAARPEHPGVILSYELPCHLNGKPRLLPLSMPCDTFTKWEDNLRAIALTLEALRKIDRYGVTQSGEQYTGWAALPPPAPGIDLNNLSDAAAFVSRAAENLHVPSRILSDPEAAKEAYRAAARKLHPDNGPDAGGDAEEFKKLQTAWLTLQKHHG